MFCITLSFCMKLSLLMSRSLYICNFHSDILFLWKRVYILLKGAAPCGFVFDSCYMPLTVPSLLCCSLVVTLLISIQTILRRTAGRMSLKTGGLLLNPEVPFVKGWSTCCFLINSDMEMLCFFCSWSTC